MRHKLRVDAEVMARGRVAYDAFCSHCHGLAGAGDGIVVQRGYTRPPPLYDERLKEVPVGHIFDVITSGFGAMPDHAAQIKVTSANQLVYLRDQQREWLKHRDAGLKLYLSLAKPSEKERRQLQYLGDVTAARLELPPEKWHVPESWLY